MESEEDFLRLPKTMLPEDEANPCQIYVMSLKNAINTISTRHS